MAKKLPAPSRRERQVLDIIYGQGTASAGDVHRALPDPPSYSGVRAILASLHRKGHVRVERRGTRYVYHPTVARDAVRVRALTHVIDTFFAGSLAVAVTSMLDQRKSRLTPEESRELEQLLRAARKEGR